MLILNRPGRCWMFIYDQGMEADTYIPNPELVLFSTSDLPWANGRNTSEQN